MAEAAANPIVRKTAADFAAMAKQSAKRGSKNFVWLTGHDDRDPFPGRRELHNDNPFASYRGWSRFRWLVHDVRVFGAWETLRKCHYLQIGWYQKGEKIYHGTDDYGNSYWSTNEAMHFNGGRWVEAKDPHWFRGQDAFTAYKGWLRWTTGNAAHTPAEMKARGEYGILGRDPAYVMTPFTKQYVPGMCWAVGLDPTFVPQNSVLFSPWYNQMKEAGFSRWVTNMARPVTLPFFGDHDIKDEVVEEFYRGQAAFNRGSRGNDHDEWKN